MLEKTNITQTTLNIIHLYNDNYTKSLHLREIARKTKKDVNTTQHQLKKLEEIKVLSSTIKGKNKEYVLNLNNVITKYYLIMAETFAAIVYLQKNFIIKKVLVEIENKIDGPLILFGSFANVTYNNESDIDIFSIDGGKIENNMILKTARLIGRDINIKSTTKSKFSSSLKNNDPLIQEVISNHIVLRGVDEFCDIMWRYYETK